MIFKLKPICGFFPKKTFHLYSVYKQAIKVKFSFWMVRYFLKKKYQICIFHERWNQNKVKQYFGSYDSKVR